MSAINLGQDSDATQAEQKDNSHRAITEPPESLYAVTGFSSSNVPGMIRYLKRLSSHTQEFRIAIEKLQTLEDKAAELATYTEYLNDSLWEGVPKPWELLEAFIFIIMEDLRDSAYSVLRDHVAPLDMAVVKSKHLIIETNEDREADGPELLKTAYNEVNHVGRLLKTFVDKLNVYDVIHERIRSALKKMDGIDYESEDDEDEEEEFEDWPGL